MDGLDQYGTDCFGRLIFATMTKSLGLKGLTWHKAFHKCSLKTYTWLGCCKKRTYFQSTNKLSDWVIEYAVFIHWLAPQWRPQRHKIWPKGSLGGEDDSWTSNTRLAQRKCTIPHSDEKYSASKSVVITLTSGHQVPANNAVHATPAWSLCFGPRLLVASMPHCI